jgi:aryl-phospho-beta-D-glucosidase BglC (GH1 family)
VFNEPLSPDGDGHTWDGVLKPYHEALVAAIRAVDPDNVIILGTPNWSQHVDTAAMNPLDSANPDHINLMYTLHFYACSHQAELRERGDTALALGLPLFVTEWGATHADGGTPDNPGVCVDEAQAWHDWMGDSGISWAAWKWDNCGDESCFFVEEGADVAGNWTDEVLHGHGFFVRDRMRE